MSTLKQEDSIERQKSQVEPYAAKHAYEIVRVYSDPGISGSEITRRKEFQRMLRDAQTGAFQAILCDDKDRFGRFDSIDAGEIIAPLRRKGVWVDTVAQGKIDWNSFAGRVTDAVLQEAKHLEQAAISHRVLSHQLLAARNGVHTGGFAPYGYRLEPHPVYGKILVPDGHKAEVVRFIFRRYDEGATLGQLAAELAERGVSSPSGLPHWSRKVLRGVLTNRKYVGDTTWGVHAVGKRYRHGGNGVLVGTPRGGKRYHNLPPSEWVVREQTHEGLVDRDLYARVQGRLAQNRGRKTPLTGGGEFVLCKLLTCGNCGAHLLGATRKGRRVYLCGNYIRYGKAVCNANRVVESQLVDVIIRKLQELFLDPQNLAALRAEIARQEEELRGADNRARLERQLRLLAEKIRRGEDRLLEVPREAIPSVTSALARLRQQQQNAQDELKQSQNARPAADLEKRIAEAEAVVWSLQEAVRQSDCTLLRLLLHELIDHVELHFTHTQQGHRVVPTLDHGIIYVRPQEGLSLSPHVGAW
jgi:DNA invertase Pin-like site-specific DNA recombinase